MKQGLLTLAALSLAVAAALPASAQIGSTTIPVIPQGTFNLAQAYPAERQSLLALLSAGRLALKQLQRPSDALLYYKAAKASRVPHLDWESNIQAGIQDAQSALGSSYAPPLKS